MALELERDGDIVLTVDLPMDSATLLAHALHHRSPVDIPAVVGVLHVAKSETGFMLAHDGQYGPIAPNASDRLQRALADAAQLLGLTV